MVSWPVEPLPEISTATGAHLCKLKKMMFRCGPETFLVN
ncbi:hypothetical protein LINGRAHAP2_LOCUS34508 [Linum grandiflorum]